MTEFALLAPLFFGLLFAIVQAGLMLYIYNSAQHAVTLGAEVIAADGNVASADVDALTAVHNTDFGQSKLVSVNSYDVYLLNPDGSQSRDTSSCSGSPCHNSYDANMGPAAGNNWPATARNTHAATADYVEFDIHYDYHYFFSPTSVLHLTCSRTFRLEPLS